MIKNKITLLKKVFGISLIVLGIFGFLIPLVPGWLFILLGLAILEIDFLKKITHEIKKIKKK